MGSNESKSKSKKNDQPNNQLPRQTQSNRNDFNMQSKLDQNKYPNVQAYENQNMNYNKNMHQPFPNQYSNNQNLNPGLPFPEYPAQGMNDKQHLINYSRNTGINNNQTNPNHNPAIQMNPYISQNSISPSPINNHQFNNNAMKPYQNCQVPTFSPNKEFQGMPFHLPQNQAFKRNSDGHDCFKPLKRFDEKFDKQFEYPPYYQNPNQSQQNPEISYNVMQNQVNKDYNNLNNYHNLNDNFQKGNFVSYKMIGPELNNHIQLNKSPNILVDQSNPNYQVINPNEYQQFQNYSSDFNYPYNQNNNQYSKNQIPKNYCANAPRNEKKFYDIPMDQNVQITNINSPYLYYPNQSYNPYDIQIMKPSVLRKKDVNNEAGMLINKERVDLSQVKLHEKKNSYSENHTSRLNFHDVIIPSSNRMTNIKKMTKKLEDQGIRDDISKSIEIKNSNLQENYSIAVPRCTLGNIENVEDTEKAKNVIKKKENDATDESKPCGGIKNHKQTQRNY